VIYITHEEEYGKLWKPKQEPEQLREKQDRPEEQTGKYPENPYGHLKVTPRGEED
jgi:hypothetical protein